MIGRISFAKDMGVSLFSVLELASVWLSEDVEISWLILSDTIGAEDWFESEEHEIAKALRLIRTARAFQCCDDIALSYRQGQELTYITYSKLFVSYFKCDFCKA